MTEPKKKDKVKKMKVNENGEKGVKFNLKRETSDSQDQAPVNKKVIYFCVIIVYNPTLPIIRRMTL